MNTPSTQHLPTLRLDKSKPVKTITVSGVTNPKALAGSIAAEFRNGNDVSLHAIGHQAVGQAVKAVPIATTYLVAQGIVLTILPSFEDREIESEQDPAVKVTRTVLRLRLVPWNIGG